VFHTLRNLISSSVLAADGSVGRVVDAYVDYRTWTIQYLLVAIAQPTGNREMVCFPGAITGVDSHEGSIVADTLHPKDCAPATEHRHIRSARAVLGSAVSGSRGPIGCTEDAIVQADSWVLRFLLLQGVGSCKGAMVLLQPSLIDEVREDGSLRIADDNSEVPRIQREDSAAPSRLSHARTLH
jgi:hypothetical protein